jgi:two-component system, OmpR family, copper resistance phosphate regulon response regulator CusR
MNLLVVEDDNKVASMLKQGLAEAGNSVTLARNANTAIDLLKQQAFELVLLDLGLPGVDGIEVLRHVRKSHNNIPVIILTARDSIDARVHGLDEGADDYLVKPFAFAELLARIKALHRRSKGEGTNMELADLKLDLLTRSVERGGKTLDLTPKEFDLLAYLIRAGGQIVSREMLARDVWKVNSRATPLDNVIDVHVSHLREKVDRDFEPKLLHTVRGVGFVIRAP